MIDSSLPRLPTLFILDSDSQFHSKLNIACVFFFSEHMTWISGAYTVTFHSSIDYALINRARGPYEEIFVLTFTAYGQERGEVDAP